MGYSALLWTNLSLLLFLIFGSTDLITEAIDCQSSCGNISIPYPFGIGKGCYLDEWFEVQCNNSASGKLVPYLPKINKEVVSIYLPNLEDFLTSYPYGSLLIKTNITSTGCSKENDNTDGRMVGEVLNFTGSPFTIGASNILVAVGCNNKATLTHLEPRLVGCLSSCGPRKKGDKSRCNGYKCCQADTTVTQSRYDFSLGIQDLPEYLAVNTAVRNEIQVIGVSIEDITNQTQSCRVAFLTDEFVRYPPVYPGNKLTDPHWFYNRKYVTVQLRWVIPIMNESFIKSLGCERMGLKDQEIFKNRIPPCLCKRIQFYGYNESFSWSCQCSSGYKGNPYLPGGCKDIDECKEHTSDGLYCSESETCVNTEGDYECVNKRIKILKITIGLSVGFGGLIFISICFRLFKFINRRKKYFKRNGGLLLQQQLTSREDIIDKIKVFTSKELKKATENFSSTRVLGRGGQGTVYKGMLVDGRIVAVKKFKVVDEDKLEEFINEIVILSQINHRHIVKLLGCCLETEVPLLVYEYIPNGNLFEHLHNDSDDYAMATWEVRLRIALDIAEALSYLHSAAASPIYHRDIKTANIMLDEKHRGKVSDFGTSKSVTVDDTHLTTVVAGTLGYLDPEYYQSSQFTDKSDVYSFGVVLVELITGQKPIRTQENESLATYFVYAMKDNKLLDIIDPRIRDGCKLEQVIATARLAKRCLNPSRKRRPNMRAVATELERIRSPNGNSKSHVGIVESEEDEGDVEINIDLESYEKVGVTAPSVLQGNANSTSLSDVEPLFPRQTW